MTAILEGCAGSGALCQHHKQLGISDIRRNSRIELVDESAHCAPLLFDKARRKRMIISRLLKQISREEDVVGVRVGVVTSDLVIKKACRATLSPSQSGRMLDR